MALRNQSNRGKRRLMSDMNVVPYIDVMLVLVVILMVAAPFVNPSVVNLPSVKKAGKAPTENIQVVVHADSRLSIKTKSGLHPVDMPQLVNRREGKSVFYSLADGHVRTIIAQGREHIEE